MAHIATTQGTLGLNAAQFGQYVLNNYSTLTFFNFAQNFIPYREQHFMAELVGKLKAGMDDVSCAYIEHQEKLYNLLPLLPQLLLKKEEIFTPTDRMLLERCEKMTAAGRPAFLKQVNLEWRSEYTNFYGLYDTPQEVLAQVNGKAVLDVGAYVGDSMSLFRDLFPQSPMYAFEPDDNNLKRLEQLLAADIAAGRLHACHYGVGDKHGVLNLHFSKFGKSTTSLQNQAQPTQGQQETVEVVTIDEFVAQHQLQVGLIKADIEGGEPEVVYGALETIKSQKPLLVLAIYHNAKEYYELKPFLESLNLGYSFKLRRSCFCNPFCELVLIAVPPQNGKA